MNAEDPTLFVTLFGSLSRHNFPPGSFERRELSAREAKQRIDEARTHRRLRGVSDKDLAIDRRAMHRSQELLETLASLPEGIHLTIDDFVRHRYFAPLNAVAVGPGADLLVVSCLYELPEAAPGVDLAVDSSSISFDLFSARTEQ
jgi:hypothetical protein